MTFDDFLPGLAELEAAGWTWLVGNAGLMHRTGYVARAIRPLADRVPGTGIRVNHRTREVVSGYGRTPADALESLFARMLDRMEAAIGEPGL